VLSFAFEARDKSRSVDESPCILVDSVCGNEQSNVKVTSSFFANIYHLEVGDHLEVLTEIARAAAKARVASVASLHRAGIRADGRRGRCPGGHGSRPLRNNRIILHTISFILKTG
jgi:hypothetical protein